MNNIRDKISKILGFIGAVLLVLGLGAGYLVSQSFTADLMTCFLAVLSIVLCGIGGLCIFAGSKMERNVTSSTNVELQDMSNKDVKSVEEQILTL